jgi:SPP1 gp7 family putative phage head morphogenesis protein
MIASIFDVRVLHFAASDRQHCFLCEFFWDALSNQVCVDTTVDGSAVLFVRGATRLFFSFALLFFQTCFLFRFSFTLDTIHFFLRFSFLGFDSFLLFAFCPGFCFLLLACRTLFRFDSLAFRQFSAGFLFGFTARCGFNLCFVLRFCIAAGLLCRFTLNAPFVLTLSLFRQAALLFAVTVKLVIHQQSHFVVRFDLRGTLEAFNNLSQQSQVYASQTTLQQLLSSPGHLNQVAAARLTTFSDWKVISDTAHGDLTNIITDAVARGVNPRETASVISKRLDVSMSKAKTIAQTEQVGALRQAQWNETDWAADRLGLNTGLLWLSALKPTTRTWHASRHGKVYTTEEVRDFYAENGNRYNCYCSQIPVLLNDDGSIFNEGLKEKLATERKGWQSSVS